MVAVLTNFLQHRIPSWHKKELNSAKAQWAQQLAARLCVFSQLQETVGSGSSLPSACQHHCHVSKHSPQCLPAKRAIFICITRINQSCWYVAHPGREFHGWRPWSPRPSLGIALSCLTQGPNLPWGLSTSSVCSVWGAVKPGREWVGAQLCGGTTEVSHRCFPNGSSQQASSRQISEPQNLLPWNPAYHDKYTVKPPVSFKEQLTRFLYIEIWRKIS